MSSSVQLESYGVVEVSELTPFPLIFLAVVHGAPGDVSGEEMEELDLPIDIHYNKLLGNCITVGNISAIYMPVHTACNTRDHTIKMQKCVHLPKYQYRYMHVVYHFPLTSSLLTSSLLTSSLTPLPTDWLIDRRHCELKWVTHVRQIRESVSHCLQQLPGENEEIARIRGKERECAHEVWK